MATEDEKLRLMELAEKKKKKRKGPKASRYGIEEITRRNLLSTAERRKEDAATRRYIETGEWD